MTETTMPPDQEEKTDAAALAQVLNEVEQEYQMLLREQPALMKPQVHAPPPPQKAPNSFRRNRRRRN